MKTALVRLAKLEAQALTPARVIPMFVWGMSEDEIETEQAEIIQRGVASGEDTFQVFTWLEAPRVTPSK